MVKRGKEITSDNRETQKDREGLKGGGGGRGNVEKERERGHCLGIANPIQS